METWALDGSASHRLFMDVKLIPDKEKRCFEVSPPFFGCKPVTLNVEYRTYKVDEELRRRIAKDMEGGNFPKVGKTGSKSTSKTRARGSQRNLRGLRDYLHDGSVDVPLASREVVLCPKS